MRILPLAFLFVPFALLPLNCAGGEKTTDRDTWVTDTGTAPVGTCDGLVPVTVCAGSNVIGGGDSGDSGGSGAGSTICPNTELQFSTEQVAIREYADDCSSTVELLPFTCVDGVVTIEGVGDGTWTPAATTTTSGGTLEFDVYGTLTVAGCHSDTPAPE